MKETKVYTSTWDIMLNVHCTPWCDIADNVRDGYRDVHEVRTPFTVIILRFNKPFVKKREVETDRRRCVPTTIK